MNPNQQQQYYGQPPPPGQYPPYGQQQQSQGAPYYQQPPHGQQQHQQPYGQHPSGSPAPGQPPYQQPPPGQPPYQQGQYPGYGPPQGQPPTGQYPPQSYPGGPTPPSQYSPQGQPGQYQNAPYPPQQPPQGQYGQPPAQYGQQQPPPGQYPPQQYGAPPQAGQQWPQQQQHGYGVPPTPASPGYDPAQRAWSAPVDTSANIEALRKAMKGMGCDEKALIRVVTSPKYTSPWAMQQLVQDYNRRFVRDLAKDIESETRGSFETALLALIRGPLEQDVRVLHKALVRAGTDEEALMDVLLCRSNADVRAIAAEYKRIIGHDLLVDIKDDVDDNLFRLYSMVLNGTRAEDAAPVIATDIDHKVTELQRATEGMIGANAVSVAQIFTSSNSAQIHAMADAYQRKYHRSLEEVIEKEFRGDMEDCLLRMLSHGLDRARSDAKSLEKPLYKTPRKDRLFINRVVRLYWDRTRLEAAKVAYQKYGDYRTSLAASVKAVLSGDYEDLIIALLYERR